MNLNEYIDSHNLNNLIEIQKKYETLGYKLYLVGGAVRDALLGFKIKDFDLSTNAPFEVTQSIFKEVIPTGIDFGTLTVLFNNSEYEITRFRKDLNTDGRRATVVEFSNNLLEDLKRRDLTINGLAYDINNQVLIDKVNGLSDLKNHKLNFIGNPIERIKEDNLRSVRFYRFLHRYSDFKSNSKLDSIIKNNTNLNIVSIERIFQELNKMLSYNNELSENVMKGLININLFKRLNIDISIEEQEQILKSIFKNKNILPIIIKHYLIHNCDKKKTVSSLKISKNYKNIFLAIDFIINNSSIKNKLLLKSVLRFTKDKSDIKSIFDFFNIKFDEKSYFEILDKNIPIEISDLKINGNDLLKLGFQGKEIKKILNQLLYLVWNNENLNTFDNLINSLTIKNSRKNSLKF